MDPSSSTTREEDNADDDGEEEEDQQQIQDDDEATNQEESFEVDGEDEYQEEEERDGDDDDLDARSPPPEVPVDDDDGQDGDPQTGDELEQHHNQQNHYLSSSADERAGIDSDFDDDDNPPPPILGIDDEFELLPGTPTAHANVQEEETASPDSSYVRSPATETTMDDSSYDLIPPPPSFPPPSDGNTELWMFADEEDDDDDNNPFYVPSPSSMSVVTWTDGTDFSSSLFRLKSRDSGGNLVLIFIPALAKRALVDLQLDVRESRFSEFISKTLASATFDGPRYVLVIILGEDSSDPGSGSITRSDLIYMSEMFSSIDYKIRKAVQHVYVVHPSPIASHAFWLIRTFLSGKFWRKLIFVRRIGDVPNIDTTQLIDALPKWVTNADLHEEKRRSMLKPGHSHPPSLLVNFSSHWRVAPQFVREYLWELSDKSPFGLPSFVIRAITYLCLHGIKVEGLFRESANRERFMHSRDMLETGQDIDFGGYWSPSGRPATQDDVHVVAALLKNFFRTLPLRILGHPGFIAMMKLASNHNLTTENLVDSFKEVMLQIAAPNRQLLHFLLLFLNYVIKYERINRMGATAMSVCWGPNLISDENDEISAEHALMTMGTVQRATVILIERVQDVFPMNETTIFPPCYNPVTGEPLPLDEVLIYDVTRAASSPSLVEKREYDDILAAQVKHESKLDRDVSDRTRMFIEPQSLGDLEIMSVRDLKTWLKKKNFDVSLCKEKSELLELARTCMMSEVSRKKSLSLSSSGAARSDSIASLPTPGAVNGNNSGPRDSAGVFRSNTTTTTPPAATTTVEREFDIAFDEVDDHADKAAGLNGGGGKHMPALTTNAKDRVTSCRSIKLRFALHNESVKESNQLIKSDADQLRTTALFWSKDAEATARQVLDVDLRGKRWSLTDISTMPTAELKRLITTYGHEFTDCRGISALRERARDCLLGGIMPGLL